MTNPSITFPAGRYAVADPVDIFAPADWHRLVFEQMKGSHVAVRYRGAPVFVWSASAGACCFGVYQKGSRRAVALSGAGLMCIVPAWALPAAPGTYVLRAPASPVYTGGSVSHGPASIIELPPSHQIKLKKITEIGRF